MNYQDVSKKRTQLKSFVNDMGPNAIVGISESWLSPSDDMLFWKVASNTHEFFRCDRSSANSKKRRWCNALCTFETCSEGTKRSNLFDKTKFDTIWVECRNHFSKNCKKTMLINVTYNLLKQFQNDFLEQLETNIDISTCETANITMMGDYNLDYLAPI